MAEILLTKVVNNEIELKSFLEWLSKNHSPNHNDEIASNKCSQPDFITYFLNFVHEDIPNTFEKWSGTKGENPKQESAEIDNINDPKVTSTPKTPKIVCLNTSYLSPVSPLYRNDHSFTTPTSRRVEKSPICLGDFIVKPRNSKKKSRILDENCQVKRRINPTSLTARNGNGFRKSENSFDFNKSNYDEICSQNADEQRNLLTEERRKISFGDSSKKIKSLVLDTSQVEPQLLSVYNREKLDRIVEIYVKILVRNLVLNVNGEIRFLVSLLLKKQAFLGTAQLNVSGEIAPALLFTSIHNVVYFASKCLESQIAIVKLYDKTTVKILAENCRLNEFSPEFVAKLKEISQTKIDCYLEISPSQDNICFIIDTDNRLNFPNDSSFHAFKKQRDLFYEILRIWENGHATSDWDFSLNLRGKIRSLLSLSDEPSNYVHFTRLFKAQLLNTCRNYQSDISTDFISSLPIDAEKLNRLKSRLVTKQSNNGINCLPSFTGRQEFYKEFILTASNYVFNRHLCDSLICEIVELNGNHFSCTEYDDREITVDKATKKAFYACLKSLRLLAKFLGFVESIPYKTDCDRYSENLMAVHVKAREQVRPNFDVKFLLETSIFRRSVVLCVPWLTEYLAMLDYATLRLPYYDLISKILFGMYRNFQSPHDSNVYLIKFCLDWLFELPHYPEIDCFGCIETGISHESGSFDTTLLDLTEIVDQNVLYYCCPYLEEIKKLLVSNSTSNSVTIKHITPVTAIESPDEVARKKLEQQLEEAFFSGQPVSTRKTVEFVSERVASTCVKYIVATLVPNYKKVALERVRLLSSTEIVEDSLIIYKTKVNQLAVSCLIELKKRCEEETVEICNKKIENAIESLVALDVLARTKDVCVGIAKKTCLERVKQWIGTHVTSNIFAKDFDDEIKIVTKSCQRKDRKGKSTFVLPPEGTRIDHNDQTTSAAHLLENIQDLCVGALEGTVQLDSATVFHHLEAVSKSLNQRGDINDCIAVSICTLLVDLSLVLLSNNYKILMEDNVMIKFIEIWKSNHHRCGDLFKSLICARNVGIFEKSNNVPATWTTFARFCCRLIKNDLLSCDCFASQCTGIFQNEWDQNSLKRITTFFREFVKFYREGGGCGDDFTFLLDFLSDYCQDL